MSVSNLVVFRCDASPQNGTGHVMRCMALAEELERRGFEPVFAVSPGTAETVQALATKSWRLIEVAGQNEAEQAAVLAHTVAGTVAALIVDHYGLGKAFESAAREFAGLIAVLEDRTDRQHDCDLLINSNAGLGEKSYKPSLVPEDCRVLLGPRYAPLRSEFKDARQPALARRKTSQQVERVLVSFGGCDPANGTGLALAALEPLAGRIKLDVAIGAAAPALKDLQRRYAGIANFHVGTDRMAQLMSDADLAIGGGGSTAWERATLGLPTVIVTIADNQYDIAYALDQASAAIDLGSSRSASLDELRKTVESLTNDSAKRLAMAEAASRLTDGFGAARLAIALSGNETAVKGEAIWLRRAELEDQDLMLRWQREPGARHFSRNPQPPSPQEHARWFPSAVADPARVFAVVECDGIACGFVRLDARAPSVYEVSLLIAAGHQGRGIGTTALRLARKCAPRAVFDAHILPENKASVAAFSKAGYIEAAEGLMRSVPA